jgi:DNA polymerase III alpha subunit (gram-positive type)
MLNFLAKNNVNKDDAFKFAELVRKGNQYKKAKDFLPLVAKLQECNVPQ